MRWFNKEYNEKITLKGKHETSYKKKFSAVKLLRPPLVIVVRGSMLASVHLQLILDWHSLLHHILIHSMISTFGWWLCLGWIYWQKRASWGVWQSGVRQGSFTQSQQSVNVLLPLFPKGLQTPGIAEAVSCFGGTSEILTPCSDHGNQENLIYPLFFLQRRIPAGGE